MSSYNISEPSAIKRLKSNGKVVDDNGNVINEGDYWQKVYNESEPKVDKILKSDGSIIDSEGNVIQSSTEFNVKKYTQAESIPAKYLHSDGTIDENPGEGGSGANLQNNKQVNITSNGETVVNPDSGYDGLKKVTVNVNVPSSGGGNILYAYGGQISGDYVVGEVFYTNKALTEADDNTELNGLFIEEVLRANGNKIIQGTFFYNQGQPYIEIMIDDEPVEFHRNSECDMNLS